MKRIRLLVLLCVAFSVHAQQYELGKVTVAELEEKTHPTDPSAEAAVLFKKGKVRFEYSPNDGFVMVTDVMVKIKIYKKEGYDYASKKVAYYLPSRQKENVSFDDAVTYNLVNGQIVKTKLKGEGLFEEKVNKFWGQKKIAMPAVQEGSVIEYSYRVKSPNYEKIDEWSFQEAIPVNFSQYEVCIPEYFIYNPSLKGFVQPKVTTERKDRSIVLSSKERSEGLVTNTTFSQEKVNYVETKTTYTCERLPALREEKFVNNIGNYTASVTHELSATKFPNRPLKSYSADWASMTKTIYDAEDFGNELHKTGYFERDIDALLANIKVADDRVAAVFEHVKRVVKWNGYYSYFCMDGVGSAYKNKTGNVAEINLMLTAMLRHAGVTANPVLVSTRANGVSLFPNRTAYNYVICAAETPSGRVLLDATEKFATPNILPVRDLNWYGRLIRKDGTSEMIDLMPKLPSREITYMLYAVHADGSITGKLRNQYTDYKAMGFRQQNSATALDSYLEALENNRKNIEISSYLRENEQDSYKPIVESYDFKDNHSAEIINGKIYLSPMLFFAGAENPFKLEKREYPIDFGFPVQDKFSITIDIPDGYTVESLPKPMALTTEDGIGSFKYMSGVSGNKIQVMINSDINAAILGPEYYEVIKGLFQKMVEQNNEKIVLVKA